MSHRITVIGASELMNEESSEFQILSPEETASEFCDEVRDLGDGVKAFVQKCYRCERNVIAINHLPSMYMVNVCYGDGQIFRSIEVCPDCVYTILKPENPETGD